VLTYTTQFMQQRIDFLTASGMLLEDVAKAVVSHPQGQFLAAVTIAAMSSLKKFCQESHHWPSPD